jgi:hypothetical protein
MDTGDQREDTFDLLFPIVFIFLSPLRIYPHWQLFEPTFLSTVFDVIGDIIFSLTSTDLSLVSFVRTPVGAYSIEF